MKLDDRDKLKHDFMNSIVIINCMTKSASSFLSKLQKPSDGDDFDQKQMEKFLHSMDAIREQTAKIEHYFLSLLNE